MIISESQVHKWGIPFFQPSDGDDADSSVISSLMTSLSTTVAIHLLCICNSVVWWCVIEEGFGSFDAINKGVRAWPSFDSILGSALVSFNRHVVSMRPPSAIREVVILKFKKDKKVR